MNDFILMGKKKLISFFLFQNKFQIIIVLIFKFEKSYDL
jgi:hypothetical protein